MVETCVTPSGLSLSTVIPIIGGSLLCGATISLSAGGLTEYGLKWNILKENERQTILLAVTLVSSFCSVASLGLNQTLQAPLLNSIFIFLLFLGILYALMMINHNSIIRIVAISDSLRTNVTQINKLCLLLYCLPPILLIPIYLAWNDAEPKNLPINKSTWNSKIYKPEGIAILLFSEGLATASDVIMIWTVSKLHRQTQGAAYADDPKNTQQTSKAADAIRDVIEFTKSFWIFYASTWLMLCVDLTLKVLIYLGYPVLFDSAATCFTLALRGLTILRFGLELKTFREKKVTGTKISKIASSQNQTNSAAFQVSTKQAKN